MKILHIRFKNLNSLRGEWHIDLTHQAYVSEGFFAIIGPTGAGKTTLLDALCLALYGRTPRLDRVTKSTNEIMTRQTGECFAEVTFATQSGHYRCHWSQHRARRHAEGELQAPKHEIANADNGELLESQLRKTGEKIEAVTGMDFEQFTRSMLLAQGGFAAFLQAAADERAPILEQITGTEIYSQISMHVHERRRAEQEKLNTLEAVTAGITLLLPEQEAELTQTLATQQVTERNLEQQLTNTKQAINWLGTLATLKQDISQLTQDEQQLHSELNAFQPERERLQRAQRAQWAEADYATLAAMRSEQNADVHAEQHQQTELPALEAAAVTAAEAVNKASVHKLKASEQLNEAAPVLLQVRELDARLAEQSTSVERAKAEHQQALTALELNRKQRQAAQTQYDQEAQQLNRLAAYFHEHAADEALIGSLAGIEEQLQTLQTVQEDVTRAQSAQEEARLASNKIVVELEQHRAEWRRSQKAKQHAEEQLERGEKVIDELLAGRSVREYRADLEHLNNEKHLLARIASLEEQRRLLEADNPCPLCGALEHPYAAEQIPAMSDTEQAIAEVTQRLAQLEEQEALLQQHGSVERLANDQLLTIENAGTALNAEEKAAQKAFAEATAAVLLAQARLTEAKQRLAARLAPLGVQVTGRIEVQQLVASLKARLQAWQAQVAQKTTLEQQLQATESAIKRLDAVIDSQAHSAQARAQAWQTLQNEQSTTQQARHALYGQKNPTAEEQRLQAAIQAAEIAEKHAIAQQQAVQQQVGIAQTQLENLQSRVAKRKIELERNTGFFASTLLQSGFADESTFLAARLTEPQRQALEQHAQQLDDRSKALQTTLQDRQARLLAEQDKQLTDQPLAVLEEQHQQQQTQQRTLQEHSAALKHQLAEQQRAKQQLSEQQAAIDAQRQDCLRWNNLHELIGSADGKKYRNFAQGLTFELMVSHANQQLQKMSDRYVLVRDPAEPLQLNVLDNYQGGEMRTTKNLSGGESFIVSLALALGLSNMASKNVRVDSLFLDEGFGTLDDEALDTALDTLAGLQQDGKLIGVISHVQALKERISTQIQVVPKAGGRSRIQGPGCSEVTA